MLAVQKDVYSAFSAFLAGEIVQAYDSSGARDPELRPAIDQLRGWNGQMEKGTAAPLVASLLYDRLEKAVADRASPGKGAGYDMQMAPAVIENLLRARPKDWFPDFDRLLLACLREAIQAGRKLGRADVSRWDYGHYSELTIRHPVGSQLPFAGKYFSVGPAPMSGSSTTVKQTTRRLGPSMRMIVDLSDLDQSMQNITVGESGQILSSHYQDQWESYYVGRSFPMQFQKITPNAVLTVHP